MTLRVRLEPITPRRQLNLNVFEQEWLAVCEREIEIHERAFRRMTNRFRTRRTKPTYRRESFTSKRGGLFGVGGRKGVGSILHIHGDIFRYLDLGTDVKRVILSRNYRPGTRPGVVGYSGRRGRVLRASRNISGRGIRARNFRQTVVNRRRRPFVNSVRTATRRAARRVWQ